MTEPWFEPSAARYFALFALLGLTALATPWIVRGRYRRLVQGIWIAIIIAGAALVFLGVTALVEGQPYHVTATLLLTGAPTCFCYAVSLYFIERVYQHAERRKVAAREL